MTTVDPFIDGRPIPNQPVHIPPGIGDDTPPPDPPPPTNGHHPKRATTSTTDIPPHDLDAQQQLLGAALLGHPLDTPPEAFYGPHRLIAQAIHQLQGTGETLDPVILADHLRATGHLDHVGGIQAISTLYSGAPATSAAPGYARIVTHHWRTRQLLDAAAQLATTARLKGPDAAYELLRPLLEQHAPQADNDRLRPGSWILDAPAQPVAIWGHGTEVLWAQGEPCLITGPPGVGKTTLTGQLVRARLGADPNPEVLGWPIQPDTAGRVLYLASDRPQQIRRSLNRHFTEADRPLLEERLTIWPGPPPTDLARDTSTLVRLAHQAGATTVILDSLKDMAIGLSDDEVGAGLNQAMQLAIAEGIDVLALHHQRKSTDGKRPKTLEDLYGSTWIAAGAGSILLLWGQAGDLVIELHHLKQPASDIGPLKIEHDHDHGRSRIHRGFDLHTALRNAPNGLTTLDVARIWLEKDKPTENERRKAQRRLDNLVKLGHAHRRDPIKGGSSGTEPSRYYAIDHHAQETP